jgi:inhibitor of Bruton tyrosine kinase
MYTIANYDYDCTKICKSFRHSNTINSALTKRQIADDKLAAFIAKTCKNYVDNVDELGRSSLHMCASVNRLKIAEWLIKQKANISLKDKESGK